MALSEFERASTKVMIDPEDVVKITQVHAKPAISAVSLTRMARIQGVEARSILVIGTPAEVQKKLDA